VRTHVVLYIPSADIIYTKPYNYYESWNMLLCDGIAKLADLENAKKLSDHKTHEIQMARKFSITLSGKSLIIWFISQQGNIKFMSIEAAAHMFLFHPFDEYDASENEIAQSIKHETETITNPIHFFTTTCMTSNRCDG
jgi:hypothetical protein